MRTFRTGILTLAAWAAFHVATLAGAAELVTLTPENWDEYAPQGKEVDAIYGDYVLRNDKIIAVIGNENLVRGRSSDRSQGLSPNGQIIDLTLRDHPNDLLINYFPGVRRVTHQYITQWATATGAYDPDYGADFKPRQGQRIELKMRRTYPAHRAEYASNVTYILEDGWDYVQVGVHFEHPGGVEMAPKLQIQRDAEAAARANVDPVMRELLDETALEPEGMERLDPAPALGTAAKLNQPTAVPTFASLRADNTFETGLGAGDHLLWIYNPWHQQAYGVLDVDHRFGPPENHYWWGFTASRVRQQGEDGAFVLPGKPYDTVRRVYPARHQLDLIRMAGEALGQAQQPAAFTVIDAAGPVSSCLVHLTRRVAPEGAEDGQGEHFKYEPFGAGHTDAEGRIDFALPKGHYQITITPYLRPSKQFDLVATGNGPPIEQTVSFESNGHVEAVIVDGDGKPGPAKVEFRAKVGRADPMFFDNTGDFTNRNLVYTPDGTLRQEVPPGKYQLVITRGPEYDAAYRDIEVAAGKTTTVEATVTRVVDTAGWIAADMHSHSTLSGWDNQGQFTSTTIGRVMNHAAEGIEFAPATEHNRIYTWEHEISLLGLAEHIKSCTGIGYTDGGRKYAYNEQNAFPFPYLYQPRTQGNGARQRPHHCAQLNWLAAFGAPIDMNAPWATAKFKGRYDGPEKLIQILHHKNIIPENPGNNETWYLWAGQGAHDWPMMKDTDEDGEGDLVASRFYNHMDALELRSLKSFLDEKRYPRVDNDILDWLVMLRHGYRIVGAINSRAEHNFHGSGGVRNYIASPTDQPASIEPMDVVHAVKAGQVVMTTGPFLTVEAAALHNGKPVSAAVGGDMIADAGKVRLHIQVQVPNWITIDRVSILLNSERQPNLTFTRKTHSDMFLDGVMTFDQNVDLELAEDTHIIVIADGHGPNLRQRTGDQNDRVDHIAVANPIYVDADADGGGEGFRPQAPTADVLRTSLRVVRPVLSRLGSPPGKLRLTVTNPGDKRETHDVRLRILPAEGVELVGRATRQITVEPGSEATMEIEFGIDFVFAELASGGFDTEEIRIYVERSYAGSGMRGCTLSVPVDHSPQKMSTIDSYLSP